MVQGVTVNLNKEAESPEDEWGGENERICTTDKGETVRE